MHMLEALSHLAGNLDGAANPIEVRWRFTLPVGQVGPLDEFHHQIRTFGTLPELEHPYHVRMFKFLQNTKLAPEPRLECRKWVFQKLDRHRFG